MIDAPREEALKAIQVTKTAGIKTIMITGDNKTTAVAVAKERSEEHTSELQSHSDLVCRLLLEKKKKKKKKKKNKIN
mgnify:CR=1 FL=1